MQRSLWESVLPEGCLRLPAGLERVDAWLDDERFFAPFVPYFSARMGRPSIPMETYLRLMFLKHRYRLGYESLCAEVSDSISWRRFCRIDGVGLVPLGQRPRGREVVAPRRGMRPSSQMTNDHRSVELNGRRGRRVEGEGRRSARPRR